MDINKQMLAKKYAKACVSLFPSIVSKEQLMRLAAVRDFLVKHNNALFYANLGVIEDEFIAKNFIDLFRQFGIDHELDNLIELLIVHKRLFLLRSVIRQMEMIIKNKLSLEEFVFSSSHELSSQETNHIQKFLEKKLDKDIIYKTHIDKDLIAGIKIYSPSWLYEYSIKKRLETLCRTS